MVDPITQDERELLRSILIQQFKLHEIRHHLAVPAAGSQIIPSEPIAHTPGDIYKCLHQAEFGLGHSIDDPHSFRDLLIRELSRAIPNSDDPPDEPITETISPDGTQLRINLRPYRRLFEAAPGTGVDVLLKICLTSAENEQGDPEHFLKTRLWRQMVCRLCIFLTMP